MPQKSKAVQSKAAAKQQKGFYEVLSPVKAPSLFGVPSSMVELAPGGGLMWVRFPRDTPTKTHAPQQFATGHGAISSGMCRYSPERIIGSRPHKGKPICTGSHWKNKVTVVTAPTEGNSIRNIERMTGKLGHYRGDGVALKIRLCLSPAMLLDF